MGNIYTVGPNEALVVSGTFFNFLHDSYYFFRTTFVILFPYVFFKVGWRILFFIYRGVFTTLSIIYDGEFWCK